VSYSVRGDYARKEDASPLRRLNIPRGLIWLMLVLLSISILYPLVFVVFTALKTPSEFATNALGIPRHPTLTSFRQVFDVGIGRKLVNSAIIAALSVALTVVVSSLAAFALVYMRFSFRKVTLIGIAGLMIQPSALLMIPEVLIVGRLHLTSTYSGIVLVYTALAAPFATYMMYTYMQSIPRELFEAARVDGARLVTVLRIVILPLLIPAIGALIAIDFIAFWNEFLFALLILQNNNVQTVVVGLATLQSPSVFNESLLAAGMALSIIPPLVVFIAFHRRLFRGLTAGGIR
jgi:ABC-type glycerol-3-phosphate transport system permease component